MEDQYKELFVSQEQFPFFKVHRVIWNNEPEQLPDYMKFTHEPDYDSKGNIMGFSIVKTKTNDTKNKRR